MTRPTEHRNDTRVRAFEDPLQLFPRILTKLYSIWISQTYPFASVGGHISVHYTCELRRSIAHRVSLGQNLLIAKDAWINVSTPLEEAGEPVISIEDNCCIGRRCQISALNQIHLEPEVILSPSVLIMDHSHAYEDVTLPVAAQGVTEGGKITIGQGCWIGHHAAIICDKGELRLGRNCVVAANSVVTRSFPPYSVISGNPARVVKQFDPAKKVWVLGSSGPGQSQPAKPQNAVIVAQRN